MEAQKDLAIVIKSIQFAERHRIVTAITQNHGIITAMAKNAVQSKRFGGALDLFIASDWILQFKPNNELAFLSEAQVRQSFDQLRKNFEKFSLASVFTEFLLRVGPQNQPCPEFFQLHANALYALNENTACQGFEVFFLNSYLMKLLQLSGNQPQLGSCLHCQIALETLDPQSEINCLIADAGWICPSCRSQSKILIQESRAQGFTQSFFKVSQQALLEIGLGLVTPIRRIILSPPPALNSAEARDRQTGFFRWIEGLFIYHIPGFDQKPMNSLRFLGLDSGLTKATDCL